MKSSHHPFRARFSSFAITLAVSLTACEDSSTPGDKTTDAAAPAEASGSTFTNGDGYPELTGPPVIAAPSAAKGTQIKVTIPYDSDTRYVRLAIEDYPTSKVLLQNWAEAVPAGGGTVEATVTIPSTTTPTDTYYFTFDLCSSDACYDPFKRTTYEREGTGTTYVRIGYSSPPLTKTDALRDSGIPIPTFLIQ